jgi:hypothetical protein
VSSNGALSEEKAVSRPHHAEKSSLKTTYTLHYEEAARDIMKVVPTNHSDSSARPYHYFSYIEPEDSWFI